MENEEKKDDCCQGCKAGHPGTNPACQAKLMIESVQKKRQEQGELIKSERYEN